MSWVFLAVGTATWKVNGLISSVKRDPYSWGVTTPAIGIRTAYQVVHSYLKPQRQRCCWRVGVVNVCGSWIPGDFTVPRIWRMGTRDGPRGALHLPAPVIYHKCGRELNPILISQFGLPRLLHNIMHIVMGCRLKG